MVSSSSSWAEPAAIKARRIAANAYLLAGAGCNVLMVMGLGGIALVDGGLAENAESLLQTVAHLPNGGAVRVMFDTHWHPENSGANAAVRKLGGKVIAHENTQRWLSRSLPESLQKDALPNEIFQTSGELTIGMEMLQYAHLPEAHTNGDIYVFLPKANILMAGDAVSVGRYPILDFSSGGWIGGMVRASRTLLAMANSETRIVPGQGAVQNKANLQTQYDMLAAVMERLVKLLKQGMTAEGMIAAAPTKDFDATWGDPKLFISSAYQGLRSRERELG